MFLEGLRLCEEGAASGVTITAAFYTSDFALEPRGKALLTELKSRDIHPLIIPEKILDSITDTRSPQGIVILAKNRSATETFCPPTSEKIRTVCRWSSF